MNILVWILQILLALHTAMGAIWKFSNSEKDASLDAIPNGLWQSLSYIEFLCVLGLLLPAVYKPLAKLAPIAALVIAAEMLMFCAVNLTSDFGKVANWFTG